MPPAEPPTSPWRFPTGVEEIEAAAQGTEIAGVGADLEPGTLLSAYRAGLFPMPADRRALAW